MSGTDIVLIVDDDALVRETYAMALRHDGWTTVLADSANTALERLGQSPAVSVMITDLTMPGELDGRDLVTLVRAKYPSVGVVLTTGKDVRDGYAGDGVPVLLKPFSIDQLMEAARRVQPITS